MRLTSNTPQGNLEQSLNLFYAKDGETWVRGYGENGTDIALLDLMRKLICRYMEPDEIPETMSDEAVMFAMVDWLYGGTDSMEGVLALLYLAGWVCAELRECLKRFEDKEPMADEYIERERLLRRFNIDDMMNVNGTLISLEDVRNTISNFPAADVAPVVHGRKIEDGDIGCFWLCSLCGECLPYGAKYCPNCGAKMDLEVTDNG